MAAGQAADEVLVDAVEDEEPEDDDEDDEDASDDEDEEEDEEDPSLFEAVDFDEPPPVLLDEEPRLSFR
ncbi:hypothetical protein GCM10010246_08890 [Streptomyces cuspidosporus]|uniref:DNA primase n=1 Tax=Streptomyces cuspidosporus TaxID=66882 RepID=A0ABP5SCT6_9ACTN